MELASVSLSQHWEQTCERVLVLDLIRLQLISEIIIIFPLMFTNLQCLEMLKVMSRIDI